MALGGQVENLPNGRDYGITGAPEFADQRGRDCFRQASWNRRYAEARLGRAFFRFAPSLISSSPFRALPETTTSPASDALAGLVLISIPRSGCRRGGGREGSRTSRACCSTGRSAPARPGV